MRGQLYALAIATGIICGLISGILADHRLAALEQRLAEISEHAICRLPAAPAAHRLPVDADRPTI